MGIQLYDYAAKFSKTSQAECDKLEAEPKWASAESLAGLAAPEGKGNLWLAEGLRLSFNPEDVPDEDKRNQHVVVIGGSGAGKTRSVIIPNIWKAADCNIVAIDPKGEIDRIAGDYLRSQGYEYSVINLVDPSKSAGYDPLGYVCNEADLSAIVEELSTLTVPRGGREKSNDYFWPLNKRTALRALVGLLFVLEKEDGCLAEGHDPHGPRKYLRMNRLLDLLGLMEDVGESGSDSSVTVMEHLFGAVGNGEVFFSHEKELAEAGEHWSNLRGLPSRTYNCVKGDVASTLDVFRSADLRQMYDRPGPRLDKVDEGKQFVDIIVSDSDSSRAPIVNMIIRNLIERLERKADSEGLSRRVELLLDEFANIGKIPDFEKAISTARSRGINFLVVVQTLDQLDGVYGSSTRETIISNCDTVIYLGGGSSTKTADWVSSICGEYVMTTQRMGDEGVKGPVRARVISGGEVGLLGRDECIVKVSGRRACLANKINLWGNEQAREELNGF